MLTGLKPGSAGQTAREKHGFYIGVTCPGCGGSLEIEDDLAILICSHCSSVLRIEAPDVPPAYLAPPRVNRREIRFAVDRYLKENDKPLTGSDLAFKYVYYPYWKTDGILLKLRNVLQERTVFEDQYDARGTVLKQEKTELSLLPHMDTFRAGRSLEGIPEAIGIRAQYIKLVPFSEDNVPSKYQPLEIVRDWKTNLERVRKSVAGLGRVSVAAFGSNRTELLRPLGSIVYFPFVMVESYSSGDFQRFVVDGVTSRVLDYAVKPPPLQTETEDSVPGIEFGSLGVVFHRCYNCGEDLPATKSYVNICDNCHVVSVIDDPGFSSVNLQVATGPAGDANDYFPFWSFKMPDDCSTEVKNLFAGVHDSDWLTIPAFKMPHFEAMYRLSKRVSAAIPKIEMLPVEDSNNRYLPVSLSASEAQMLSSVVIQRRRIKLDGNCETGDVEFLPKEVRLLYIPFKPESYFFVDTVLGAITFEKASLG